MSKLQRFLSLFFIAITLSLFPMGSVHAAPTVTVYLQVMDSCRQALPGANFTLVNPNGSTVALGPSAGSRRVSVGSGSCPLSRGNCASVSTGCVSWTITAPTSGTATYTLNENPSFDSSDGFYENPAGSTSFSGFVPCNGGSACPGALDPSKAQSATFTVNSSGTVSSVTTNPYPDGKFSHYPSSGSAAGTRSDPIVFHNFQLGNGSCDGDSDADDHLTGSPSSHCNNDGD